jgi:DNA-binding MarR family transcriptional regulator
MTAPRSALSPAERSQVSTAAKRAASGTSKSAPAKPAPDGFDFPTDGSFGYLLRDTHRAFSKVLQARIASEQVTIGMWYFLRALWEEEGLTQRELSRRIGMMESTAVPALALMERRGLVTRERDAKDRRRSCVYLTKRGRALKSILLPYAKEANQVALEGLSEADQAELRRILRQVRANLERALAGGGAGES